MTNFVYDDGDLPFPKVRKQAVNGDPNQFLDAPEWNAICQAAKDIQTFLRGGVKLYKSDDGTQHCDLKVFITSPDGVATAEKGSLGVDIVNTKLYQNTDGAVAWSLVGVSAVDPGLFGDGSDGTLHFDGAATILGIVPSGNTYTLTRDIYASTITIDVGVTVIPNRFRIFANVAIVLNGKISGDGAAGATGDAGGAGGAEDVSSGSLPRNAAGGAGHLTNGDTANGGGNTPRGYSGTGGVGAGGVNGNGAAGTGAGSGGGAGATSAAAGGSGGDAGTALNTTTQGDSGLALLSVLGCGFSVQNGFTTFSGRTGGGGGGGGGDGFSKHGGGGGASGHYLVVCAPVFTGSGSITSKGGNGGNGETLGNATGGGGGGGGYIVVVYSRGVAPTTNVSGGVAGTHTGTGGTSANGSAGVVRTFKVGA